MYLKRISVGPLQTNCYLAGADESKECFVIDPGEEAEKIASAAATAGRKITAVLLTHGHFDHIGALSKLRNSFDVKVYAGEKEKELLADPMLNLSSGFYDNISEKADCLVADNTIIYEAGLSVKVIETPGHTIGGICFYLEDEKVLFSGDTLFQMSVGRTDFPTSSASTLVSSIKNKLYVLPDEVVVYSGHGEPTDIGFEKKNNMFV